MKKILVVLTLFAVSTFACASPPTQFDFSKKEAASTIAAVAANVSFVFNVLDVDVETVFMGTTVLEVCPVFIAQPFEAAAGYRRNVRSLVRKWNKNRTMLITHYNDSDPERYVIKDEAIPLNATDIAASDRHEDPGIFTTRSDI